MTDRSQAAAVKDESLAGLTSLTTETLSALPVPLMLFDRDLNVVYRNPPADQTFPGGKTLTTVFEHLEIDDRCSNWQQTVQDVITRGLSTRFDRSICHGPHDSHRLVNLIVSPIRRRPQGPIIGGLLAGIDITGQATLEQNLASLEKLANSGQLVERVAHELNNPLDGILRYLNLALRVLGDDAPPKVTEYLTQSRDGVLRMVQITGDLLAYSRNTHAFTQECNINRIVEEAVRSMQDRATEQGVVISAGYRDDNMPCLKGTRLYQVCCNLIKNALDAMPSGGMLTIQSGVTGDMITLRFEDTGVGLPEDLERIFEPFYTTKPSSEGTGLGLAICKDFVERLGGTITADRRNGGGAAFTIRIPVNDAKAADSGGQDRQSR